MGTTNWAAEDFSPEEWAEIESVAAETKAEHLKALATGVMDKRTPLEPPRRAWFKRQLESYNPDEHPDDIPAEFEEGVCNIFGHICPVFFSAEGCATAAVRPHAASQEDVGLR